MEEELDTQRDWRFFRSTKMVPKDILRAVGFGKEPPIWADEVAERMGVSTGVEPSLDHAGSLSFVNDNPVIIVGESGLFDRNVYFAVLLGRLLRDPQCIGPAWMKPPYAIYPDDGGDDGSAQVFAEDLLMPAFAIYAKHVGYSLNKLVSVYAVPHAFVASRLRRHLSQPG